MTMAVPLRGIGGSLPSPPCCSENLPCRQSHRSDRHRHLCRPRIGPAGTARALLARSGRVRRSVGPPDKRSRSTGVTPYLAPGHVEDERRHAPRPSGPDQPSPSRRP
ncbi:hypothetical protein GCM10010430_72360 [Kitasatospora cystarginea]|uniref:Uncharacterized protein n=1 Tax=Kitasatospora cystarginea TaxID=58350 RepID=A0ABP5RUF4_9ACTN